jgi:hypothetical protein
MPVTTTIRDDEVSHDEETPLLSSERGLKKSPTPVPWSQIWILLVLQLAEPLTSQVIYPFTPEVRQFVPTPFTSFHASSTVRSQCWDHEW